LLGEPKRVSEESEHKRLKLQNKKIL